MRTYFNDASGMLPSNSRATIRNSIAPLTIASALWQKSKTKFSFIEWRKKGAVIVLGYNRKSQELTQPVNHLLLKYSAEAVLDVPGETEDLSWFFLDEISNIGSVPRLISLMDLGRGKGARVVTTALGFLNLQSVFANEHESSSLIAQSHSKAILRLNHPDDIDFAQRLFGRHWVDNESMSYPTGPNEYMSRSVSKEERYLIDQADLMSLHLRDDRGIDGFVVSKGSRPIRAVPPNKLNSVQIDAILNSKNKEVNAPGFVATSKLDQVLVPWDSEDYTRLNLTDTLAKQESEDVDEWKLRS